MRDAILKIKKIYLSREGRFAREGQLFTPKGRIDTKKAWIENHDLYLATIRKPGEPSERVVTPVICKRVKPIRIYMMDAVTGTLYDCRKGLCLSSEARSMVTYRKDGKTAQKLLETRSMDFTQTDQG